MMGNGGEQYICNGGVVIINLLVNDIKLCNWSLDFVLESPFGASI